MPCGSSSEQELSSGVPLETETNTYKEIPAHHRITMEYAGTTARDTVAAIRTMLDDFVGEYGSDTGLVEPFMVTCLPESLRVSTGVFGTFVEVERLEPIVTRLLKEYGVYPAFGRAAYHIQQV